MSSKTYPGSIERTLNQKLGENPSILDYGAVGDARVFTASCTASSATVESVATSGTGAISSSGVVVTGSSTDFLSSIQVGTFITAGGQTRRVDQVLNDTSLAVDVPFSPNLSAASFTVFVGFRPEDVGKDIVVHGGGGGSDRESEIGSVNTANYATTDSFVVVDGSEFDTQGATVFKAAANSGENDGVWQVYGANASDFSDEVSVHGPEDVLEAETSVSYTPGAPTRRYYRVKVKSKNTGQSGIVFVTMVILGRVKGSTIASYISPSQVTLATVCGTTKGRCHAYFGTDNTAAIQRAMDQMFTVFPSNTADGGIVLAVPRGAYLFSDQIFHKFCVILKGPSGGGAIFLANGATFPTNVPVWNMTGTFPTDARIAFFTRLEDLRIDCSKIPGSIGVFCDALQENSGLFNVTIIQWLKIGVKVCDDLDRYGCGNWVISDIWCYPATSAFLDDTVRGVKIDFAPNTTLRRSTIYGQGGFINGYGVGVEVKDGMADIYRLHIESARIGVWWNTGSTGILMAFDGQYFVRTSVELDTSNPVCLKLIGKSGAKYVLVDNISGTKRFDDYILSEYFATALPVRFRNNNTGPNLVEFYGGQFSGSLPTTVINRRGCLRIDGDSRPKAPNVLNFTPINFDGPHQGGWLFTNAEPITFPYYAPGSGWTFTADAATDTFTLTSLDGKLGHALSDDDTVEVGSFGSGSGLPGGLVEATTYYVINANQTLGTLQLSLTEAGAAVSISNAGTGTHHIAVSLWALGEKRACNRWEVRFARVPNDDGTEFGSLVLQADYLTGVYATRINFDATGPLGKLDWGNILGDGRSRWVHGETGQDALDLEGSNNAGVDFGRMVRWHLSKRATQPYWIYFHSAEGLLFGNDIDVNRAKWDHGSAGQVVLKLMRSTNSGGAWSDHIIFQLDTGAVGIPQLTASRPVLTDGGSYLTSAKIDVNIANHIAFTGASSNSIPIWNSGSTRFDAKNLTGPAAVKVDSGGALSAGGIPLGDPAYVDMPAGMANGDVAASDGSGALSFYTLVGLASNLHGHLVHTHDVDGTTGASGEDSHTHNFSVTSDTPVWS